MTREKGIALGWRVRSWSAVVVAVSGRPEAPDVIHRERVTLIDDESARDPDHAAASLVGGRVGLDAEPFLREARALIESIDTTAAAAALATLRGLTSSLGALSPRSVLSAGIAVSRSNCLRSSRRTRCCTRPRGTCTSKRSSKERPAPGCR